MKQLFINKVWTDNKQMKYDDRNYDDLELVSFDSLFTVYLTFVFDLAPLPAVGKPGAWCQFQTEKS